MRTLRTAVDVALTRVIGGAPASQCETPALDFKEDKASSSETIKIIAEAAICFANSAGGIVVVGVSHKKKGRDAIIGTNLDLDYIRQRVYELSSPHLVVDVERHIRYNNVLLVLVSQSSDIHSDNQGRAWQRINTSCFPMSPDQQARLREERRGIDWSAEATEHTVDNVLLESIATAKKNP